MASIEGIGVNSDTITNCYKRYYPNTYNIIQQNLYHYLHLFGIRISTCDTSLPDDLVGGMRVGKLGFNEMVLSNASTDPSPKSLIKLFDQEAITKGGTAFMIPGQNVYTYPGPRAGKWGGLPYFCPTKAVRVYRWMPSKEAVAAWKNGSGRPLSELFDAAVREGKVKISDSSNTCIHKAWSTKKLYSDSAGCQVVTDEKALIKLGAWANDHLKKLYRNTFYYTLFTAEQFVQANRGYNYRPIYTNTGTQPAKLGSFWDAITNILSRKK
jgi:hypothetical protein